MKRILSLLMVLTLVGGLMESFGARNAAPTRTANRGTAQVAWIDWEPDPPPKAT